MPANGGELLNVAMSQIICDIAGHQNGESGII